jgi:hypothetical protein
MDDLQAQPGPLGDCIALGKGVAGFNLDQALRFLGAETKLTPGIDQQVLGSEIGFGDHVQWIDFLIHPDGDAPRHGQQPFAPDSGQWEDMCNRCQHRLSSLLTSTAIF